jgi:hypothetical protein
MSTASNRLTAYLAAEIAVLSGQSFSMAGRTLTRTNLGEIRKGIAELRREVQHESMAASGRDGRYAVADFSRGVN